MQDARRTPAEGFAVLELLLVLVIIAGIVGVGLYVLKQKQNANSLAATTTSAVPASPSVAHVPAAGTTAAIDQLTNSEMQAEIGASGSADNQIQQDVSSTNTTVSNVGGAYNASSF